MLMLTNRNALVISKEWKETKYTWMFNEVFSKLNFSEMCLSMWHCLRASPIRSGNQTVILPAWVQSIVLSKILSLTSIWTLKYKPLVYENQSMFHEESSWSFSMLCKMSVLSLFFLLSFFLSATTGNFLILKWDKICL